MGDSVWPDRLCVGDRVRCGGRVWTVTGLCGRHLTLADSSGAPQHIDMVELLRRHDVTVDGTAQVTGIARDIPCDDTLERARWWQAHIVEVLTGLPPDARPGAQPRPDFDPDRHSLAAREAAKARELTESGVRESSARTVRRKRQRYQALGLAGLVDGRAGRHEAPGARLDARVVDAVREIVLSHRGPGPVNVERVRAQLLVQLAGQAADDDVPVPSRSALRRLCSQFTGQLPQETPAPWLGVGDRVHLDVLSIPGLNQVTHGRHQLKLLFALDEASGVLLTAVACADPEPVYGPALLARMCVPADQRANWISPWPSGQPGSASPSSAAGGAPVIRPRTLVVDRAAASGMTALRDACARRGIHVQSAAQLTPQDRGRVERVMTAAAGRFAAYLFSPAGRPARAAGWQVERVQELLDIWLEEGWSRQALPAGTEFPRTPLERYEDLTAHVGQVSTPLSPEEFRDLLNISWRTVGPSGLRVGGHAYNAPALHVLRRPTATGPERRRFEVRWDPYDLGQVWLRASNEEWLVIPAAASRTALPDAGPDAGSIEERGEAPRLNGHVREHPAELPEAVRLAYHAQLQLRVACVVFAVDRIDDVRLLNRYAVGPRYGVLLHGQAGTGKTTALLEARRRCTAQSHHRPGTQSRGDGAVPVVYVRLPPATSPRLLLVELARSFGLALRGSPTTSQCAHRVAAAMKDARTDLVLVDEAQHLHGPGWSGSAVADTVDYLCDRIPATFVFAGIGSPASLASAVSGVQHRRLVPVQLTDMPAGEDWCRVLAEAEAALRLRAHEPGTLTGLAGLLHERTGGNTGRLTFLLRTAAVRAVQDGSERLTAALLSGLPIPEYKARDKQPRNSLRRN
ncbi:AAA family ATPase [Streptomyces sp. CoH27]|uniref:AAA family ATPase n=1 Tax=Streptomyces sp. CoH27 TaxID=2875763 RepID=UPI001CD52D6F|nr:AAA family ATPase [Streptomyces sp. CoH27]